jgi:hypothetical protein
MKSKYGEQHYMYREAVLAEFTENMEGALIQLSWINRILQNPPRRFNGVKMAGVDLSFSQDGDESVIVIRYGNYIEHIEAWRDNDSSRIMTHCLNTFEKYGIPKENIYSDAADPSGAIALLRSAGWPINTVMFGSSPISSDERYPNRMTELWFNMANEIQHQKIILPNDDELITQLINRKYDRASNGYEASRVTKPRQSRCFSPLHALSYLSYTIRLWRYQG